MSDQKSDEIGRLSKAMGRWLGLGIASSIAVLVALVLYFGANNVSLVVEMPLFIAGVLLGSLSNVQIWRLRARIRRIRC